MLSSLSLPAALRRRSYTPHTSTQRQLEVCPTFRLLNSPSHVRQPHEVFAAVERKDIMFLMEVRDKAFHLLVKRHGGVTPLVHAMRCGKSHQDVTIVILGAFSRYINHLSDEDFDLPATKVLLRDLRLNLRQAIDMGLQLQQSDLIASFLQTLVMSEGERWVRQETVSIAAALRLGAQGKPVNTAEDAVRGFATKELGKASMITTYEDYVANATGDLVMMGAWQWALDSGVESEPIPVRLLFTRSYVRCLTPTISHRLGILPATIVSIGLSWTVVIGSDKRSVRSAPNCSGGSSGSCGRSWREGRQATTYVCSLHINHSRPDVSLSKRLLCSRLSLMYRIRYGRHTQHCDVSVFPTISLAILACLLSAVYLLNRIRTDRCMHSVI